MSYTDQKFSKTVYDIEAAIRKFGFPVVIRSEKINERDGKHPEDDCIQIPIDLPRGSITVLERKLMLQFAHVSVVEFRDLDKNQNGKGVNFIHSHRELENKDYLLPLTFEGKCKIVHPPGKQKRYVDVTELIKDLPRWIQINDQLGSFKSEDDEELHVGEVLEIVGVKKIKKSRCVVCRNKEQKKILIRENMPVDITAVDDTNLYTLNELTRSVYLPKSIEFADISPDDIVLYDDTLTQQLLVMTGGPLKIISVVEREVILGWWLPCEPCGATLPVRTVIIPKSKWKLQKVKARKFNNMAERLQYSRTYFPGQVDSEYINHKLYLMDAGNYPGIVWIKNLQPFLEQPEDEHNPSIEKPPPSKVEKDVLTGPDLDADYEIPLSKREPDLQLPPGQVLPPQRLETTSYWRLVRAKLNAEIRSFFDKKSPLKPQTPPRRPSVSRSLHSTESNEVVEKEIISDPENVSSGQKQLQRLPMPLPKVQRNRNERKDNDSSDCEIHDYDYPDVGELTKKGYVNIDIAKADRVSRTGQTKEDFYDYTIDEVVFCFKMIAQLDMADKCKEEKLDGKFFQSLSEGEIKEYFRLDSLHFIKVKKAILEGWRPK